MILLIWSIYVIVTKKYQISGSIGVKGKTAVICGVFNLLVALGLMGAIIPIGNILINLLVQLVLIVTVSLVAVAIHGNDFKKGETSNVASGGTKVLAQNKPILKYCSNCGEVVEAHEKFCGICGKAIGKTTKNKARTKKEAK